MKFTRVLAGSVLAGLPSPWHRARLRPRSLKKVGISVGSLGNPFFVATIKGITDKAKAINPSVGSDLGVLRL